METNSFSFQIGKFKLAVFSDGWFPVTKDFFFSNTPDSIISHFPYKFNAPLNFLFIDTGEKKILVDAGFWERHLPVAGHLLSKLKAEGMNPEDIDIVVITHGHMDRIDGASFKGEPTFPNAEYMMRKDESDFWNEKPLSEEFQTLMP